MASSQSAHTNRLCHTYRHVFYTIPPYQYRVEIYLGPGNAFPFFFFMSVFLASLNKPICVKLTFTTLGVIPSPQTTIPEASQTLYQYACIHSSYAGV